MDGYWIHSARLKYVERLNYLASSLELITEESAGKSDYNAAVIFLHNVWTAGVSSSSEQKTSRSGEGDADEDQERSLVEQEEQTGAETDAGHSLPHPPHLGSNHSHRPHREELQQQRE